MSQHEENGQDQEQQEPREAQQPTTIGELARVEIDMQIATAKHYPRSVANFKTTALKMATLDEETAASCFYSLPRAGKQIVGPSARLAEIVAVAWKNLRFGARVVSTQGNLLTAQGVCHDLESNIAITYEVQRRITDKSGRRFSDDMVVVTGNAASSIALRNAVLKVVPKAYWSPVYDQARKVAVGDQKTLVFRRTQAIDYFQKMGVSLEMILRTLDRKSAEDIDLDDLATLQGLKTSLKEGDTSIEEAFAPPAQSTADKIKDKLAGRATKEPVPAEEPKPAAAPPPAEKTYIQANDKIVAAIKAEAKSQGEDIARLLKPYECRQVERLSQEQAQELLDQMRGGPEPAMSPPGSDRNF